VVVKFLNAQPHYADSFWATFRSALKFFAFLKETNLYASYFCHDAKRYFNDHLMSS